jgi:hypothetical protein
MRDLPLSTCHHSYGFLLDAKFSLVSSISPEKLLHYGNEIRIIS